MDEDAAWPTSADAVPGLLRMVLHGGDPASLALSALGGAMWCLRRALIDHDILSLGKVRIRG